MGEHRAKATRTAAAPEARPPAPAPRAPAPASVAAGANSLAALAASAESGGEVARTAIAGVAGASGPLPHLDRIQAAFGAHDVRHARAAIGGDAGAAASAIGARAYTVGSRIAFKTAPDLRLAAHEAAHVVQQGRGLSLDGGVGQPGDVHEQQADTVANAVVAGRFAEDLLGRPTAAPAASVQMECDCGTCPKCAVQMDRADDAALASTPGGLRIGEYDATALKETIDKILPDVTQVRLIDLELYYERSQSNRRLEDSERLDSYENRNSMQRAFDAIGRVTSDVTLRDEAKRTLARDFAEIFARAFAGPKLNGTAIAKDLKDVGATYERLAFLYDNERIERQSIPDTMPDAKALADAFERRAQLFADFTRDKLGATSAGLRRVQQGLAADLARLAAGELEKIDARTKVLAPDRGAELLVYNLLGDPLQLDLLAALFDKVIRDIRHRMLPATDQLVDLVAHRYFAQLIREPIENALTGSNAKDRELFRREFAIKIGRYLARLTAENALVETQRLFEVVLVYIPSLPEEVATQVTTAKKEAAAPAPAPQPPAPARTTAPPPAPVGRKCTGTYTVADVQAFLDARIGLKKEKKRGVTFDPELVMCQFRGTYLDSLLEATRNHLAQWSAGATRVAESLAVELRAAQARDTEVGHRRVKVDAKKSKEVQDLPDISHAFTFELSFWSKLGLVPYDGNFDTTDIEDTATKLQLDYFFQLRRYQEEMLAALAVLAGAQETRLDVYLRDRYPETLGLAFGTLRDRMLVTERWPYPNNDVLREAEGFAIDRGKLEISLKAADEDRKAEHRLEVEKEIYEWMESAAEVIFARKKDGDQIGVDEVWDFLKDELTTVGPRDAAIAKEIIAAALGDVHRARFATLQGQAKVAVIKGDLKLASDKARAAQRMRDRLDRPVTEAGPEALLDLIRGYSTNLLGLWIMTQTSMTVAEGAFNVETAGGVKRAANLMIMALQEGGAATLGEAYDWVVDHQLELQLGVLDPKGRDKVFADSKLGIKDMAAMWAADKVGAWDALVISAVDLLKNSRKNGALLELIIAEGTRDPKLRKQAIAKLGKRLGNLSPSHSKAAGQFVYAFLLDATTELEEASNTVKQTIAAAKEAKKNKDKRAEEKKKPGFVHTSAMEKEEGIWQAAIDKAMRFGDPDSIINKAALITPVQKMELDEEEKRRDIIGQFKKGFHPIHKRDLLPDEKHWFAEWDRLGGLSEKGWAEFKEFAEGVLITVAVSYATAGLGRIAMLGVELGIAGQIGVKAVQLAVFTESMRIIQDLQTGQYPTTPFWEDFLVNALMEGSAMFATNRMARALNREGIALKSLQGRMSMFLAEYLATSGVGLAHMYLTHDVVTSADVRENLKHNFQFLVGMKAFHAFAEVPKAAFDREAKTWANKDVQQKYLDLIEATKGHDARVKELLQKLAKAETVEERAKLIDEQTKELDAKAETIKKSGIPDAEKVAEGFRIGVETFKADAKRALTMEQVGAKPLGGDNSPHLSYERGSGNEAALERMFAETEANVRVRERADGSKVYEVTTVDGVLRYEPREPGSGGTQKEAYSKTTRLAGEVVPGKTKNAANVETGGDVAAIVKASGARSPLIPSNAGEVFNIGAGQSTCQVTLAVSSRIESSADHAAGPATFTLSMNKSGRWEATITVRKSAPNDHVVRGVNHEVTELTALIARLEARASDPKAKKGARDAYKTQRTLDRAMRDEVSATDIGARGGKLSSHDLATLNADVATLQLQMQEVISLLQALGPGDARRPLLEARRALLEKDVGSVWVLLDLPVNEKEFGTRAKELEKQGVTSSTIYSLKAMRVGTEAKPRVGLAELQIIFNELKKANPNLVTEGSFEGMKLYYEESVRRNVEEAAAEVLANKGTEAEARAAGLEAARKGLGGTSIASWRGRAFEGLFIDQFNSNPALVSAYGRVYQIELNNFPTYDIVGIKMLEGRGGIAAKGVPTPLKFEVDTVKRGGYEVKVLVVLDASGREIARQAPDGTLTVRGNVEVWLASLKAKDEARVTEMQKALGTPSKPTEQVMYVTKEYLESLDKKIETAQKTVDGLTGDAAKRSELAAAKRRLKMLEFFREKVKTMNDLTNARIDSLLKMLREEGLDTESLLPKADPDFVPPKPPAKGGKVPLSEKAQREYDAWEATLHKQTRDELKNNEELRQRYMEMDPAVRRALTLCTNPCIPTDPMPTPGQIARIKDIMQKFGIGEDDPALREYLHRNRGTDLEGAISALEAVKAANELQAVYDRSIAARARDGTAARGPDGKWVFQGKAGKIVEHTIGEHGKIKETDSRSFFQSHHGIQDAWAEAAGVPGYSREACPAILLRDSHAGSPHQRVTARQKAREGGRESRTYDQERQNLIDDMKAAEVPDDVRQKLLDESDAYFGKLYKEHAAKLKAKGKTDAEIEAALAKWFGTWKPPK